MKCCHLLAALGALGALAAFAACLWAEEPATAKPAAFADITAECGVAEVLKARNVVPWEWHLVDLDGDGRLDLLIMGRGGPWLSFHNDGNGKFSLIEALSAAADNKDANVPKGEFLALAFDFSESGMLDLNYAHHIFRNESKAGAAPAPAWKFRPASPGWSPGEAASVIADMNRDGIADFIDGDKIFHGKGDGTAEKTGVPFPNFNENGAIPIDLTGSGQLDLIVHGVEGGGMESPGKFYRKILRNDGHDNFTDVTKESGIDPLGGSIAGVGDVNQDGFPDLICVEPNLAAGAGVMTGNKVCIYLNDGKGHFTLAPDPFQGEGADKIVGQVRGYGGAFVTDFDNDGIADIALSINHWLYVFRGTGGGRFVPMTKAWGIDEHNAAYGPLTFGDIDGDGRLDLISGENKDMKIYRNNLPPKNWINVRAVGKKGNRSATSAKIRLYETGAQRKLLWCEQIAVWGRRAFHSYYAASQTERHFGLGDRDSAEVSVEFYPSGKVVHRQAKANTTVVIEETGDPGK